MTRVVNETMARSTRAGAPWLALAVCIASATAHAQSGTPNPPVQHTPRATGVLAGYVVDEGRCMDVLDSSDAMATIPEHVSVFTPRTGARRVEAALEPASLRDAMLAWMRSVVPPRRRVVAIPLTDHGRPIGWAGMCLVERPLIEASEITYGEPDTETDAQGVTQEWRMIWLADSARARMLASFGRHVVFLGPNDTFHGYWSLSRLLQSDPVDLFF